MHIYEEEQELLLFVSAEVHSLRLSDFSNSLIKASFGENLLSSMGMRALCNRKSLPLIVHRWEAQAAAEDTQPLLLDEAHARYSARLTSGHQRS